jgi:hypothetical protein
MYKMELKKWHLKLYHPCHNLLEYLRFFWSFFNTVSLAMIKILASGLVATKGFKTYCFQAMNSYKSLTSFTSVTDLTK